MPKQHEQLTNKSFKSTFLNPEKVKEKRKKKKSVCKMEKEM